MGATESSVNYGSLEKTGDLRQAVNIILSGGIVAAQVRGVYGLWCNGDNQAALDLILNAKGEFGQKRPFSIMMFSRNIFPLVDNSAIHPCLQHLAKDPTITDQIVGCLLHLRLPLKKEAAKKLPRMLQSEINGRPVVHNLSPARHPISGLIRRLNFEGVKHVALTTLNIGGQPESTTLEEVESFCSAHQGQPWAIPLVLRDPFFDPNTQFKGSLTIVDTRTASIYRDGNLPRELANALLGVTLNTEGMLERKFPTSPGLSQILADALESGCNPALLADLIRNFTHPSTP